MPLMRCVALDGLDKVRDQVIPPSQHYVDLCPSILGLIAKSNEAVVLRDHEEDEQNKNHQ